MPGKCTARRERMAFPGSCIKEEAEGTGRSAQVFENTSQCLGEAGTAGSKAWCSEDTGVVEELEDVRGTRHPGDAPPHPLTC